jgi:hypothetical protein
MHVLARPLLCIKEKRKGEKQWENTLYGFLILTGVQENFINPMMYLQDRDINAIRSADPRVFLGNTRSLDPPGKH